VGNQTFIEINGKKYDALTGKLIQDKPTAPVQKTTFQPQVGVVDGFTRRPKPTSPRSVRHAVKAPQKSQTLARSAVKKPHPKTAVTTPAVSPITKPTLKTPEVRAQRARTTAKSPDIQKFPHTEKPRTSVVKHAHELAVQHPTQHALSAPQQQKQIAPHANHPSKKHTEAVLQAALQSATTHESLHHQHAHPKKPRRLTKKLGISPRVAALSSSVLAFVLLAGFFAVQNVPNLSMRVASTRAGFAAEMPGYKPAGFSFKGPIAYQAGRVSVTFKSNTDDRQFTLTQSSSNWNSDALLANYVASEKKQYQTYLDKGRTLYIYDNSNASWVDNGIWYQIEGDSSLTTDQLIRIASSL
jgi:hypothetical protein